MSTFTWTADWSFTKKWKPEVTRIAFGDQYEQRQAKGMNYKLIMSWDLQFKNNDDNDIDAIVAFLEARGALESFDWTPPTEDTAIKVVCREWQKSPPNSAIANLTATFERVIEP